MTVGRHKASRVPVREPRRTRPRPQVPIFPPTSPIHPSPRKQKSRDLMRGCASLRTVGGSSFDVRRRHATVLGNCNFHRASGQIPTSLSSGTALPHFDRSECCGQLTICSTSTLKVLGRLKLLFLNEERAGLALNTESPTDTRQMCEVHTELPEASRRACRSTRMPSPCHVRLDI
jgi:hypothetical protein